VGNNHSKVVVRAEPTSGAIGNVTVNGDSNNLVWVLVTTNTDQGETGLPPFAASSWAGLDDNRGYLRLRAGISQNLTSDIYLNDTSDIQYLRVAGEMQDHVRIGGSGSTTLTNVQAGTISTAGDILKVHGRIATILVTGGDALGDIEAINGSIGTIDVVSGSIGGSGSPVTIESAAESGNVHIVRVNASQHIYANVDCNISTPEVDGVITTFFAGTGASPNTTGDFHGSLRLGSFGEQVTIVRDLYADIDFGSALPAGTAATPTRVNIGRSLKSGAAVTFPTNRPARTG
jgi:hypothetical protein